MTTPTDPSAHTMENGQPSVLLSRRRDGHVHDPLATQGHRRRQVKILRRLALGLVSLIAVGAATTAGAQLPPPCGNVAVDTTLTGDCQGPLTVEADDVTVNLAGHQVLCIFSPGNGIVVSGQQDVRIRNGQVNNCGVAVLLQGGGGHIVTRLTISSALGVGVRIDHSDDNLLRNLRIAGVRAFGVEVSGENNRIQGNDLSSIVSNGGTAIRLLAEATGTTVRGNRLHQNVVGIEVIGADNNVRNNVANHNTIGISVRGSENSIRNNTANDNSEAGILLTEDAGPDNRIRGNRARRNQRYDLADSPPGLCTTSIWMDNRGTQLLDGCEAGTR
jgi:parallel beta-helix repeat protein